MPTRSRTLAIIVIGLVAELGLYAVLRETTGVSSLVTLTIVGVLIWSVCTIVVSERIGSRWLSLKDYSDLHGFGFGTQVMVASEAASALGPTDLAPSILMGGLVILPVAAVSGLVRRIQFSADEREAICNLGRRRGPAAQTEVRAD